MLKLVKSHRCEDDDKYKDWHCLTFQGTALELGQVRKGLVQCQGQWRTGGLFMLRYTEGATHYQYQIFFELSCDAMLIRLVN